jgi:hypothetical protein
MGGNIKLVQLLSDCKGGNDLVSDVEVLEIIHPVATIDSDCTVSWLQVNLSQQ